MTPFSVERADAGTVSVTGEIDGSTAAALIDACSSITGDVAIECSRCEFIDSAGVTALLKVRQRAAATGHAVALVDPSPAVLRIVTITGLGDVFRIVGGTR